MPADDDDPRFAGYTTHMREILGVASKGCALCHCQPRDPCELDCWHHPLMIERQFAEESRLRKHFTAVGQKVNPVLLLDLARARIRRNLDST